MRFSVSAKLPYNLKTSKPYNLIKNLIKNLTMKHQILLALLLVCFGVFLITAAFFVPPMGVIDPTVLTAFGEILTFAGAVIGIDYKHRIKNDKT